jgi:hypothetical protein
LAEATQISTYVEKLVRKSIGTKISIEIKRGCSEYPVSFPQYKKINYSGPQLMNYDETWTSIEAAHDLKYSSNPVENQQQSLGGLNLSDVLIMRNWLAYAAGIGDNSSVAFKNEKIFSNYIFQLAKKRVKIHAFNN